MKQQTIAHQKTAVKEDGHAFAVEHRARGYPQDSRYPSLAAAGRATCPQPQLSRRDTDCRRLLDHRGSFGALTVAQLQELRDPLSVALDEA